MIEIITFFVVPFVFLAIGAYWLYFSGWKRGMVQGERVTKAFLSKKIKKIGKKVGKIEGIQFDLEKAYTDFDQRITTLERKKGLKPKEVEDARGDFSNLDSAQDLRSRLSSLQGNIYSMQQQGNLMKQQLGSQGSMFRGEQGGLFNLLTGIHFPKPPWTL